MGEQHPSDRQFGMCQCTTILAIALIKHLFVQNVDLKHLLAQQTLLIAVQTQANFHKKIPKTVLRTQQRVNTIVPGM